MISAKVCLRWTFLTTIVAAAWIEAAPARDSKSTNKVVVDKQETEIVETRSESVASVRRERSATGTSGDDANTADVSFQFVLHVSEKSFKIFELSIS